MISLRSASCFGAFLIVVQASLSQVAGAAEYAPLNCAKADAQAQKIICSDYGLGQQEARMATLYALATSLVAMGQRGNIQDEQRAFLKERDACGSNIDCIRNVYGSRIRQLNAVMADIIKRGPF